MVRFLVMSGVAALGLAALGPAAAHAADPVNFNGGECHTMAREHDRSVLYVGRFSATKDPGIGDNVSDVACFTNHRDCLRWLDRDAGGGIIHIYQMSCHRGF